MPGRDGDREGKRGEMMRDIVLLSTADWDNPFWTNKQHMAVHLAAAGYRVLYIDSLGLRRPSLQAQDTSRMAKRLRRGLRPPRKVRENIWVLSPLVVPWQGTALVRHFNKIWLTCSLALARAYLGMHPDILWTYNPLTLDILEVRVFRHLVYHCVDDIKAQPGMPAEIIAAAEPRLIAAADIVFCSAPKLAEYCRGFNAHTHFFPNVADYDHFAQALTDTTVIPEDLARIPRPRIGFIGALSAYKVDFQLLRHLALARPDWSIVLIGKVGEGDPWTDPTVLEGLKNLTMLGPRDYALLPHYLKGIDVALLPNPINPYTAGMFPMKFFEYLAAGKPVVATDLPALQDYRTLAYIGETPDGFVHQIDLALQEGEAARERRLAVARDHTYAKRLQRMLVLVEGLETGRRVGSGR